MRNLFTKTATVAMVAGAALALAACGSKTETTNTTENVSMTDMNVSEGSANDTSMADMNSMGEANGTDMMGANSTSNQE